MSAAEQIEAANNSQSLLPFYWEGQHPRQRVTWLVKDIFPSKSVGLIVGESQAGKTFIAIDLAVAIAEGRDFLGQETVQGGVLIIAAEGANTVPGRLHAARQGSAIDRNPVVVMHEPPTDLMIEREVDRVIDTAKHLSACMLERTGLPLAAIIIDTLMYSFAINNWNDVGETSKAMKVLSRIQTETGATVIGVHHHGKDKGRGPAGSYAFTAAADVILSVYKAGEEGTVKKRYVTLTKSRYRATGRKIDFELASLPPDHREEDGDEEAFVRPLLDDLETAERPESKPSTSKGENAFCIAARTALEQGVEVETDDHGHVRAAALSQVEHIFLRNYKPRQASKHPRLAADKAWRRALERVEDTEYRMGSWDGQEWLYIDGANRT